MHAGIMNINTCSTDIEYVQIWIDKLSQAKHGMVLKAGINAAKKKFQNYKKKAILVHWCYNNPQWQLSPVPDFDQEDHLEAWKPWWAERFSQGQEGLRPIQAHQKISMI